MAEWAELVKPPDLADVRHMCMYLKKHREGASYCTYGRVGLEQPAELVAHPTVTRSLTTSSQYSRTGGVGMLACGPVQTISQNQHMPSPCARKLWLQARFSITSCPQLVLVKSCEFSVVTQFRTTLTRNPLCLSQRMTRRSRNQCDSFAALLF